MSSDAAAEPAQPRRRYLITGGAGFIGGHLCEALVERGHDVIALDDLSTGAAANIAALEGSPRFRLVVGSILDADLVDRLVADADDVVHLAAAVGVKLVVEQPLRSLMTNIRGTELVIDAASRHGRSIFLASSSEVYGKNTDLPLHEESDCVVGTPSRSRWGYSVAKASDEHLAFAYSRERGLAMVIGRLFNTVGPRQSPSYGMVIPRMIEQATTGKPVTVYGDGEQTRCFCHVDDVVASVTALLDSPAAVGEAFNIGGTEEVTINDLATRVIAATRSSSEVVHIPYENVYSSGFEDMLRRVPDTRKINALLGWTPVHTLDSILQAMIGPSSTT